MFSKENLLSRQVGNIYNEKQLKSILHLNVFIYGADGVAIEIIKNLCLINVSKICVCDKKKLIKTDFGTNIFADPDFIYKKNRIESSFERLKSLNSTIQISTVSEVDIKEEFLEQFDVIIVTDAYGQEVYRINKICRNIQVKQRQSFIYVCSLGLFSFLFNDFGESFKITSSKAKTGYITSIDNGKITYVSDCKFFENEIIKITEINEISEVSNRNFKIKESFLKENAIILENSEFDINKITSKCHAK